MIAGSIGIGLLVACGHTPSFTDTVDRETTPLGMASPARLTYSGDQDYWPTLTADGSGVLYSFPAPGRADHDRCVGLLPTTGGSQVWTLCDNRPGHADSTDSFGAYALDATGRLLYTEATGALHQIAPRSVTLWLADTAAPSTGTKLASFPMQLGNATIDWLEELHWSDANDFYALATTLDYQQPCRGCVILDTVFIGQAVVHGVLNGNTATLSAVAGTEGAMAYALVPSGGVVFTRLRDPGIYQVSRSGGTPALLDTLPAAAGREFLGLDCSTTGCVLASAQVSIPLRGELDVFPIVTGHPRLHWLSFTAGTLQDLAPGVTSSIFATPLIVPATTSVILQVGGSPGHAFLAASPAADLYFVRNLLP